MTATGILDELRRMGATVVVEGERSKPLGEEV